MRCDRAREALSARLDAELADTEADALTSHLGTCAPCRAYATELDALHRVVRVRAAEPVPDLTPSIMAASADRLPRAQAKAPIEWARYGLLAVGTTLLLLAMPLLAWGEEKGTPLHAARELGAFGLALAVGMVVAAWQPHRASGMLPMALALAAGLTLTAVADVIAGRAPALAESHHLLELVGVALLWQLARQGHHQPSSPSPRLGAGPAV
jgi:predicted anti-sigma-YlaC factor YlaD